MRLDGSADADFFRVVCWERTADFVAEYLGKGRLVGVEGRLQSRKYVASDGTNREIVEVVATSVQSLEKPKDHDDTPEYAARPAAAAPRPSSLAADEYDPFADE